MLLQFPQLPQVLQQVCMTELACLYAQAHPEKTALCQSMLEAQDVAAQPQVWHAYIEDGSKFVQKGQTSVSLQTQAEHLIDHNLTTAAC